MSIYAKIFCLFAMVGLTACFGDEEIVIETPSGQQAVFSIEVAKTPQEQEKGLMHVEQMPEDQGMLFVYDQPVRTKFWMKNTLIPLDMLFFDANNELIYIEHSAPPQSLAPRGPNGAVCSVLEINGGLAKEMNIQRGAKLITKITQECLQNAQ